MKLFVVKFSVIQDSGYIEGKVFFWLHQKSAYKNRMVTL